MTWELKERETEKIKEILVKKIIVTVFDFYKEKLFFNHLRYSWLYIFTKITWYLDIIPWISNR